MASGPPPHATVGIGRSKDPYDLSLGLTTNGLQISMIAGPMTINKADGANTLSKARHRRRDLAGLFLNERPRRLRAVSRL